MKKNRLFDYLARAGWKKWVQIMKLTAFLILLFVVDASASFSQSTKISVKVENGTLSEIFSKIEAQSEYRFFYQNEQIRDSGRKTVDVTNKNTLDVVNELLKETELSCRLVDRNIIIFPKSENSKDNLLQQSRSFSGKVTDSSGTSLPGVTVVVKGTIIGTITDINGNYWLTNILDNATLQFSFVGMKRQEILVGNKTTINVTLSEETVGIEEVVAIGYGTVKKSDLTGSVGSVSSKDLTAYPVTDAVIGLQGKTAGVQVIQNSGAPGATISVRIRGGNSLMGSNEPLYIVDGFALSDTPDNINPKDIESMEILKDASSTAIYGSRGANGIVLITTKRGKIGKSEITFDSYYSVQQVGKKLDLMNAKQFTELANARAKNDGFAPYFTADAVNSFQDGTDWQDVVFQTAPIKNYSINFSGGKEDSQYSISGNYFGQDGVLVGSGIERENFKANFSQKIGSKIRLSYNALLTNTDLSQISSDNGLRGNSVLSGALIAPPTISPFDTSEKYSFLTPYSFSPNLLVNPLALALELKQKSNKKYILAGTEFSYEPSKNILFKTSLGIETFLNRNDTYSPSIILGTPTGKANILSGERMNILNENTLSYTKELNKKHVFTLLGGITYQQNTYKSFTTGDVTGFTTDQLGTNNLQAGSVPGTPASNSTKWVLFSYLCRINYSYKDTYLLTGSIRADGSSRFGQTNKWGYFPSFAIAYRAINEQFVKNLTFISNLKFRLSWGETGSTAISPYQTLNTLSAYQTAFSKQMYIGYAPSMTNLANPDLKWEKTIQSNLGVDVAFLQNRLSLTFDYYIKNTKDLLANIPLQMSSGYISTVRNLGQIRNSGIELGINAKIINNAFNWNASLNVSRNRNKVIELAGGSDIFGEPMPLPLGVAVNLVRQGYPIGVFYGYKEDGLDANGAIKYKDLDGIAGITSNDRTIIGDPNPDFIYNVGSRMSYKNFELNFDIQGKQGGDIFNNNLTAIGSSFYFGENQLKDVYYNHWDPANPNPNAKYPIISSKTKFLASDRYVEDGSFVRLKNLQLAYNFDVTKRNLRWIKSLQIYVSAQNLLTVTKYSGYDPEINTRGGSNSVSLGIDNTAYPNVKLYTVGVHLGL